MKSKVRVGFLTAKDPKDKTSWSGTMFRMFDALEKQYETVIPIGPVHKPIWLKVFLELINLSHRVFFQKRFNKQHNSFLSKYYAKRFTQLLAEEKVDVIFAAAASVEIAYLEAEVPICYLSDTSFGQINDYYEHYSSLSDRSRKESNLIESLAISKSKTAVYPSKWAADYVIKCYEIAKENVHVVKFGANLNSTPVPDDLKGKSFQGPIKILFLGVDWKRKGGDIVFESFLELLQKGYEVELTVCGCIPPVEDPKMKVIPFLNKNLKEDNDTFIELLKTSHLLFVPTRAECLGIVFCEASAFAMPVITTDTGGVTSVVENGVNGYALPLQAQSEEYVKKIMELLDDRTLLEQLSVSSREKFDRELNWDVWGNSMVSVLEKTIDK